MNKNLTERTIHSRKAIWAAKVAEIVEYSNYHHEISLFKEFKGNHTSLNKFFFINV